MYPANNYLFKVNNTSTRKRSETCLKLTIKTPERRFIVNFEHILNLLSSVSIVYLEQVIVC